MNLASHTMELPRNAREALFYFFAEIADALRAPALMSAAGEGGPCESIAMADKSKPRKAGKPKAKPSRAKKAKAGGKNSGGGKFGKGKNAPAPEAPEDGPGDDERLESEGLADDLDGDDLDADDLDDDIGDDDLGEDDFDGDDEDDEDDLDGSRSRGRQKTRSEWSGGSGAEDMELIGRFLEDDDQEAFSLLVSKYQHKIHNLCFRILGDRDEAMDMAQEVFITAHKSLKNFRGDSLFSTWIFRVSVNHCKNRIKFLGRRKYYQSMSLDQPRELGEGEVFFEPEDDSPDPEATNASAELSALVQTVIDDLDADHRIVIVLRDIQDCSYEEIAEMLDIKVGTVKSRIHRARNELKKKLEARFGKDFYLENEC